MLPGSNHTKIRNKLIRCFCFFFKKKLLFRESKHLCRLPIICKYELHLMPMTCFHSLDFPSIDVVLIN